MKERILQLAKGEVNIQTADVVCFPTGVEERISPEYTYKSEVYLQSRNGAPIRAFVYSTDHRVVLLENQAVGTKCSIHYEVLCSGLQSGTEITGAFQFVALGSEFEIPYHFTVEDGTVEDGVVPMVNTMEEFGQLALEDTPKALKMFRSNSFMRMPFMVDDPAAQSLYEELVYHGNGDACAMEEFLVYFGAKKPVNVTVTNCPKSADDAFVFEISGEENDNPRGTINLKMSTAACYVDVRLEAAAPYVRLATVHLGKDDFDNGTCKVHYEILKDKLLPGENRTTITVQARDMKRVMPVVVKNEAGVCEEGRALLMRKKLFVRAIHYYLNWKFAPEGSVEKEENLAYLSDLITRVRDEREGILCSEDELYLELAHAFMYYLEGRKDDFRLIMDATYDDVSECRKSDTNLYCFYLYLRYLMRPGSEQKATVAKLLKKYYTEQANSLSILLMLIEVDEQLSENDMLAYEMLREQYSAGCRSPFLYAASMKIINDHSEKLKRLDGFELDTVIFGAKYHMVGKALAEQVAKLSLYEKEFRVNVFTLLGRLYEEYKDKNILTGLLCVLITGQKAVPTYFYWFSKGIEEDVRLTGMYEAYLDSIPRAVADREEEALPEEVLFFCADKIDLSVPQKEMLYHNVLTHFDTNTTIYNEYREQMETFAIEQLVQGRYNPVLLELYTRFLFSEMIDERIAQVLPVMLHVKKITVDSDLPDWVIVRYPELVSEYRIRIRNRQACVPIYVRDAIVVFEDVAGVRYANLHYTSESLFQNKEFLDICRKQGTKDLILNVLDTRKLMKNELKRPEDVYRLMKLLDMAEIHKNFKKRIVSKLLAYCNSTDGLDAMDSFLLQVDVRELTPEDRLLLVSLLSRRGLIKETYKILNTYGYAGVSTEVLAGVARYVVLQVSYAYDSFLLNICLELYRQKNFNSVIISYLLRYFNGITDEMMDLLDIGMEAETNGSIQVQMADFPERLLGQMMFTGRRERLEEVFNLYLENRENRPLYLPLVQAYFVVECHEYFVNSAEIDTDIFVYIEQKLLENPEYEIADICKIALLHNYSNRSILEKNRTNLAKNLLSELYTKGYLFGFYAKLAQHVTLPETLNGKVIVEYRTGADKVRMEYRIAGEDSVEEAMIKAAMENAENTNEEEGTLDIDLTAGSKDTRQVMMNSTYPDIFAEAVTLFDGERLIYSLTEEIDKSRKTADSGESEKKEETKERVRGPIRRYSIAKSRFDRINTAAGSREMDVELEAVLKEITLADLMAAKMFPLK